MMRANLLASDGQGRVLEIPGCEVLGRRGNEIEHLDERNVLPLPEGSEVFELVGRRPLAFDRARGEIKEIAAYEGTGLIAVAAFLPPAYTLTHTAAYRREEGAPALPLFAYSPLGWRDGGYVTTAIRIDDDRRQEPGLFDREKIERNAHILLERCRGNRLVEHLAGTCALRYGCPAAMNYVLGRWEMPVPTSPGCNAACLGCISSQPEGKFASTQERIGFVPTPEEIVEAVLAHLERAERPIVSFGQGCEGEPLLAADVIARAVQGIRKRTLLGTLNLNTNASLPGEVEKLFRAGLTSMRVSLNSARKEYYLRYYRPRGYEFEDVIESMKVTKRQGGFVSVNYLVFPGFTDQPSEIEAMRRLIRTSKIDMIQWRNLNIDPDYYREELDLPPGRTIGMPALMRSLREEFPGLIHGYFNPYLGARGGRLHARP